jgi:hypothetical protein
MKRCQIRQRRRSRATSGRSCSAACSVFFARQLHAFEHVVKGRERPHHDPAGLQHGPDLRERDLRLGLHERAQQILVRLKDAPTMSADPGRRRRTGFTHTAQQLHGRRGTDLIARRRLPDRTALLNRPHDPRTQILRQRGCHDPLLLGTPRSANQNS